MARLHTGLLVIGGLAVGFLVGSGVGRTGEHALQVELDRVKAELEQEKRKAASPSSLLAMAMGMGRNGNAALPSVGDSPSNPDTADGNSNPPPEPPFRPGNGPFRKWRDGQENSSSPVNPEQDFDAISSMWKLRAAQMRAAFAEQADLSAEQEKALDTVIGHMNEEIRDSLAAEINEVNLEKPLQMRDVVNIGLAVGGVYQDIDDELRAVFTEEQMSQALTSQFDIFAQMDPESVRPFFMTLSRIPPP